MATSKEIKDGYTSTLQDLTCNSKPLISVLTMLAEENVTNAKDIVEAIEAHLTKVRAEVKLPVLYLIDCIIKNVGGPYTSVFCNNIVPLFCGVFQLVDEKTRTEMYKLRQTWNDVLPKGKLYALDVQTNHIDPAWPITAHPPNIHFNPKFLKSTTGIKKEPGLLKTQPIVPLTTSASDDPATLSMQKKLILKQKELLELQHKKLELELLQTQVKLQEQKLKESIKEEPIQHNISKNLLLKPEVAKQLLSEESSKPVRQNIVHQKLQQNNTTGNVPRIAPVNSALIAASRQTRDPRLLRQQAAMQQQNTVITNVQLENKSNITNSLDKPLVTDRMSSRFEKTDPHFVNNKDELLKALKNMSRIPLKSKRPSLPSNNNKSKSSRSSKSSTGYGSTSSIDTTTKKTSRSSSKSPTKYNKQKTSTSSATTRTNNKKSGKPNKSCEASIKDSGFKDVKGLIKNRHYVRRNRESSLSPEHHDVDLRVGGPPEKQARLGPLQGDSSNDEKCDISIQGMDVDLRQMPAVIGKKRSSTEASDSPSAKKTKSQMFDVLFGNEDVDLRQLSTIRSPKENDRPPTPPAPIISQKPNIKNIEKNEKENLVTSNITTSKESADKINLDALRAKLANATNQDKINQPRLIIPETEKRDFFNTSLDDSLNKIIISPADEECIKAGNMTKTQEQTLMNKIIAQIETQSLKEAKRKDNEESFGNISLQPISDDELEVCDLGNDSYNRDVKEPEDRLNPQLEQFGGAANMLQDFRIRRGMNQMWRGPPRRGGFPGPRMPIRPPRMIEPWIRPLNKPHWVPQQDRFAPQQFEDEPKLQNPPDLNDHRSNSPPHDLVVNYSSQDNTKSINIDGEPRDIIYYDETAIAFMSPEDPREISFQNGARRIHFDDKDSFNLSFNEVYKEVLINSHVHKIRLGAPTREIYIDGNYYECYFGGPGIGIELNGKLTVVKIDGPPPQVKIGTIRRTDLVAGKINLIIDAKTIVPVYLDARVQKFDIDSKVHTLKLTDALQTVLINDVPFKVDYGGLPKPIMVHDKKHFVRFSVLPRGIKPGYVNIKDMEGVRLIESDNENSQDAFPVVETLQEQRPVIPKSRKKSRFSDDLSGRNSPNNINQLLQQPHFGNLDLLSNVMMQSASAATKPNHNVSGYEIENVSETPNKAKESVVVVPPQLLPLGLNINDLFQKLVATGIVTTSIETPMPPIITPSTTSATVQPDIILTSQVISPVAVKVDIPQKPKRLDFLKHVDFTKTATLKVRQPALVSMLYSGMQCSSCGMRFPPENSMLYSQHLDWHFRQNRKGKKNIRKATSRRWYYSIADWNNYEEIEDLEEREKCYFENQQEKLAEGSNEENDEEIEVPSIPADSDIAEPECDVCKEKFEQFYNEEKEEWHLRNATRINTKTYHPICYEDYQASLMEVSIEDTLNKTEPLKSERIPGLDVTKEEILDEVIDIDLDSIESIASTPKPDQDEKDIETEDIEESDVKPDNGAVEEEEEDDDVIINEVAPVRIILDEYEFQGIVDDDGLLPGIVIKEEPIDDGFMDIENFKLTKTKVKPEPVTPDESFEELPDTQPPEEKKIDSKHQELVIDGNVDLNAGVSQPSCGISGKIKINISKPLPVIAPKENKDISLDVDNNIEPLDPSQPLPPGEEPVQLNLKPALQGIELKKLPPVNKGSELTGLCSIM